MTYLMALQYKLHISSTMSITHTQTAYNIAVEWKMRLLNDDS